VDSRSALSGYQGLQVGDTILELDGEKIRVFEDFSLATLLLPDGKYDMVVLRNGQKVALADVPMIRCVPDESNGENLLYGLSFQVEDTTLSNVPGRILPTAMNHVKTVLISLKMLLTGQAGLKDMTGPVGVVGMMTEAAAESKTMTYALVILLWFGGFIAINLGVMNLLPIPALDGGRVFGLVVTVAIEAILRRKIDPRYEGYIHGIGMILLLILMAVVMFKDVFMLIMR